MMDRPLAQRVIGILGGASNVATGAYYERINAFANARLGGWDIAETLIAGMNFGNIEALVRDGDWTTLSAYMDRHIARLAAGGADLLLCVSNTLHPPLGEIADRHGLRLIHIADPTGAAIRAAGLGRVALFGTRPTMELTHLAERYRDRHGVEVVLPSTDERVEIDRIIFDELVRFDVRDASRTRYETIARRLAAEEGAEGVIMGYTEIFTLMRQDGLPNLPLFDTTDLHCRAAVDAALEGL
ncbi:aspartate/glutamate racemase family protein [Jannaschia aquimarina]|uniref:Putative racemase n=1 Tax=Jannaschia aquimarina TaxID=935700 RepID=A0A0D1CJ91_9RHOB|nr:amino acid racemase [Jannaschia aquimarina]KIT14772.1 putative racemase [Jannaschia aquimarina]SNT42460.1 aspartate racemase [Jannaschia aquimarina]